MAANESDTAPSSTSGVVPSSDTSNTATADRNGNVQRNDNSNPQQGTGSTLPSGMGPQGGGVVTSINAGSSSFMPYSRPTLKIPPTRKDERKLFVGGLPANVTGDEFRTFFEQFGPVIDSIVMVDRVTMRSRGFGFVTFENPETSRMLLAMGNDMTNLEEDPNNPRSGHLNMMGKTIEVKPAQPKESSRRSSSPPRAGRGNNNNNHHHNHHVDVNLYPPVQQQPPFPMATAPLPPSNEIVGAPGGSVAAPPFAYHHHQQPAAAAYYPASPGIVVAAAAGYPALSPAMYYPNPAVGMPVVEPLGADGAAAVPAMMVPATPAPVSPLEQPQPQHQLPPHFVMDGAVAAAAPNFLVPPPPNPHMVPYGVPTIMQHPPPPPVPMHPQQAPPPSFESNSEADTAVATADTSTVTEQDNASSQ